MGDVAQEPSTKPGDPVWLSSAYFNTEFSRAFMDVDILPNGRVHPTERLMALSNRKMRGGEIREDEMPRQHFHTNNWTFEESLPPLILMSFLALNPPLAALIGRFNLGLGRLHPVELLQYDRTTMVSRDYRILTIGNAIETLDLERSTSLRKRLSAAGEWVPMFTPPSDDRKATFVVKPGFSCAPDIWQDPRLVGPLFMSDRLVKALRAANYARYFLLTPCILSKDGVTPA
ncbi:MAG: hypothetical protein ACK4HF_01285 [Paracoccaceae bacterium]